MPYLHVEAVNFGATVFDTQDISTIRGASRAIEDIVEAFADQIRAAGGSVYRVGGAQLLAETDLTLDRLVAGLKGDLAGIFPHLSFITGTGSERTKAVIAARNSQFRQPTVPDFGAPAKRPCMLDRKRPATVNRGRGGNDLWLSPSVDARREYGRTARSGLYRRIGVDQKLTLPQSFEELIAHPPEGTPEAAQTKLAVLHADGAGFGKAVDAVGPTAFSVRLAALHEELMQGLMAWLNGLGLRGLTPDGALRFETLLFGGEDMDFVLPAWLALDFLREFYDRTKGWEISGVPLGHRIGCIIAHHKTPIRQMRGLADEAVDLLRTVDGTNLYSVDLFESAAPPDDLTAHRERVYGLGVEPTHFAERLDRTLRDLPALHALVAPRDEDDKAISRSQIHRLLASQTDFAEEESNRQVAEAYADYRTRLGRPLPANEPHSDLPFSGPLALRLAKTAQLWDFAGGLA